MFSALFLTQPFGHHDESSDGARLPESIAVVNVVAVPVSGSVGATVWGGYRVLRSHGPNDGVVLLADTVWPGGANVVAIGPDHLFAPREDDAQSLALLRAVDVAAQLHGVTQRAAVAIGSERTGEELDPNDYDVGIRSGRRRSGPPWRRSAVGCTPFRDTACPAPRP